MGAHKIKIIEMPQNKKKKTTKKRKIVKKNNKELKQAVICAGAGAGAGALKGGSIGLATSGIAVGVPLVVVGAVIGLAGYGIYKALKENK